LGQLEELVRQEILVKLEELDSQDLREELE